MQVGDKVGKLVLLESKNDYLTKTGRKLRQFLCLCECGNTKWIFADNLFKSTKSCGCLSKIKNYTKHGEAQKTAEYRAWCCMKSRCYNPNNCSYKNYGGRGIQVYQAWINDYESFLSYMGRKPFPSWSMDRINPNGNYEPGNVRWASPQLQNKNKRIKI